MGPLGEVLLFATSDPDCVELAYAVGAAHQGRHLASRAIGTVLPLAAAAGAIRARLVIAADNLPSRSVARRCGFTLAAASLTERRRKGYVRQMQTWERPLAMSPDEA